ncbi:MAG TPA: MBG domain-containing protein, partial [Azospirillum sp.]|nr:MBG domain-containing protein [Azospirillum sp.]
MRWFLAATTALSGAMAWPGIAAANPRGGTVVGGSATISEPAPGTLTVRQATDKAIIEWRDFSVGEREHTRFEQPSAGSIALNRVVGGNPSEILGRLSANGQVWLVNPNGIVFGRNAQVDVAGLVATTHDIRNDDFMAGRHRFEAAADNAAMVENHGTITAAEAGLVALVAPGVANTGTITARLGEVTLASGRRFVVDLYGDQRINLATDVPVTTRPMGKDGKPADALVKNQGRVFADGGRVRMTAAAAKGVVDRVIDMSGIVQARTVEEKDGEIILSGGDAGTVTVSGTLDATGTTPGSRGGTAVVTGERVEVKSGARIDVSGRAGGGEALLGGDVQGGRATPAQLAGFGIRPARKPMPPAGTTIVQAGASIAADATEAGKGGKAVVWSEGYTAFSGSVSAKGGPQGGDGGFIEISGHRSLGFNGRVAVDAPRGRAGSILFDPGTITIDNGTGSLTVDDSHLNASSTTTAQTVSVEALEAVTAGSITLTAPDGITVNDLALTGDGAINLNRDVSLTLSTNDGAIHFNNANNAIIASGTGSITLNAGYTASPNYDGALTNIGRLQTDTGTIGLHGADGVTLAGPLTTHGGDIHIDADGDQAGGGSFTSSVAITTNGGDLSIKAGTGGVTLNGTTSLGSGSLSFSTTTGVGTYTLGGQLSLSNDVTFGQPMTLNSGAGITTNGTITFNNTVTVTSGAAITLTANGFSSSDPINGQAGTLTLRPYDTTKTARVSGTAVDGELNLIGILGQLTNFSQVSYNNAGGSGGIAIGAGLDYGMPLSLTTGGTLSASGGVSVGTGQALALAAPTLTIAGTLDGPAGITLSADSLTLGAANSLTSSTSVTLQPYSAGTDVFVNGSGSGLSLTPGILGAVHTAVPSLVIGRSNGTGTVSVAADTVFGRNTTLRTGTGRVALDHAVSAGANRLTLSATGGTVTQSAAITAAGLELLGTGGTHTLTHAGNTVGTLAGDTGTVTFSNGGSFTVGAAGTTGLTVSGGLTLHAVGGDLTVAQSIRKSGSAAVGAALRADGSVLTSGGADIQLAGGASNLFNVTINPDRDADGQGAAHLGSGTTVASNGGTIEIAGGNATDGSGLLTGAARGLVGRVDGIQLDGATLNAGGGAIVLRGIGANAADAAGVNLIGGSTVTTSGTGAIAITGTSGTGAFSGLRGVNLGDSADSSTQTVSAAGGAITITGTAAAGAAGPYAVGIRSQSGSLSSQSGTITLTGTASGGTTDATGIALNGRSASKSITSASGAISLTGVGGGTGGAGNWGIVQAGDFTIGSTTGDVTLTATGGTGSLDYSNNGSGTANRIGNGTSGTVTVNADTLSLDGAAVHATGLVAIRPRSGSRAIALGPTTDTAAALELSDAELDRITAGTLRIGSTTSGAITVSTGLSPANATTLSMATGATYTQGTGITVTAPNIDISAAGTQTVNGTLGTTGSLTLTGNSMVVGGSLASTGTVTLQPYSASDSVSVAGTGGTLALTTGTLNAVASTATNLIIGRSDGTGAITVGPYAFSTNATLRTPGAGSAGISIGGAVSVGARTLTLDTTGTVSQSAAITAGGLELLGSGATHTLTHAGNAVSTLAGSTGTVSLTNSTSLTVGTVNTTGLTTTGALTLSLGTADTTLTTAQAVTAGGATALTADRMALGAALSAAGQTVTLRSATPGRAVDLGSATDAAAALELSDAELDRITAGTLRIGSATSGAITVSAALSPANAATLSLLSGAGVAQSGTGALSATNLRLSVGGAVSLGTNSNSVTTLAMAGSGTGALSFRGDGGFAIGAVDGVSGLDAGTGSVTLTTTGTVTQGQAITAGGLELLGTGATYTLTHAGNATGTIAGSTGTVRYTGSGTLTVGAVNTTGLTTTGDATLSADRIVVGAGVSAPTLSLLAGQDVAQSGAGAIVATNLRVSAGGAVALGSNSNSVTTLAMAGSGNGALSFRGDAGFAIGTVDGVSGLDAGTGDVTLSTTGTVTQSQPITAGGLSLKGTGGTYTLTHAGNAVATLAGDTGTVSYTDADALGIGTAGGTTGLTVNGTTLTLTTGGALAQTAALSNVGRLVLSAGGAIDLDESGVENTITTLGSVTRGGAFSLYDSAGGLTLDGAVGAHASGVSIRTGGALTLSGNATVAASGSADIVLAASGGDFTNARGADALSLGSGRWLVYAATRDGSTEGGLSGTREYTRSYAANAPSTVSRSGNVFLYGNTPYITVRAGNASRVYGDANPTLSATYSGVLSGDSESLAYTGSASLSTVGTNGAAGTHAITPGAGTLTSPTGYGFRYETGTLTITPAPLTVSATAQSKVYGDADPTLAYTTSGLKGSDSASSVLSGALGRAAGENVGRYTIGQGTLAANGNYTMTFTGGTLSITPAPLSIAATSLSRTYGQGNPALTGTVTGLRNGDTAGTLGIGYGTAATASSDVGRYAITPTVGALSNYTVSLTPGTLTVAPAPLTVTAEDATRTVGTANPPFTARYEGFVLGQGPGVLGGTLGFSTAAGTDSPAGGYAVTPFGLTSGNYAITYRAGTLTVAPAVNTPQVSTVIDRVTNPESLVPAIATTTAATGLPAAVVAAVPQTPAATSPAVPGVRTSELLSALASGTLSALTGADAASRAAAAAISAVAVTLGGRTLSFSAGAVAAHAAGQSLNLPSPALLNAPQVREAAERLLAAAAAGGMGKAMSAMSRMSIAEQKAAFQSVATAELINGLLTSDDPTARTVGGLLQSAVSGGGAGYADVKAAAKSGGVETPLLKTYLALYQHVDREQRTQTLTGAVQSLVADPYAADLFGRAGNSEPPRIVALDAPRDAAGGRKVIEGRIDQSARIREARVNGRWVFVDDQGRFSTDIAVAPGQNEVVLTVTDENGVVTEKRMAVEATQASAPVTDVPRAGRKIALMIATDTYANPLIPPLKTPAGDVAAVGAALNERLGYETRVLANPTKAQIIETMRSLGREIGEQDQVMLYYAGHGYEVQETGTGYWLPADADADNPKNWVSNNDVARFLNRMPAKQILVVSDSCYSGAFTREQKVDPAVAKTAPEQLLGRRSVMAMSSGGDEPVADGETNSPFAASMITRVRQLPSDSGGYELFTQVRDDVT